MRYYEFDKMEQANEANMAIMDINSTAPRSERITLYAYAMHEHPSNGRAILEVGDTLNHGDILNGVGAMTKEEAVNIGYTIEEDMKSDIE